jgi:hypothetical protein
MTRITGTILEDVLTFMLISLWILWMRNMSHKACRENQNTHFMFSNFFPKIVPFMRQLMHQNVVEPERPQVIRIIQRMCFAWLVRLVWLHARPTHPLTRTPTHPHTHKYLVFIAFPRQQWFCECASKLCYTYIACLVYLRKCVAPVVLYQPS